MMIGGTPSSGEGRIGGRVGTPGAGISNRSGNKGPSRAQRRAESDGSNPSPRTGTHLNDARAAEDARPRDARAAEDAHPRDARSAEDARPRDARSAEDVRPRDARAAEDVRPRDARSAEDVRPRDARSAEDAHRSAHPAGRYRPDPYCAVTIVCGHRQLDVALPTAVCLQDLLPGLLRLLLPDEASLEEQPTEAHPWVLTPIGRRPLTGSETLSEAGILVGDVLVLEQRPVVQPADSAILMTRDRIEDVVNGQAARFWGTRAARGLAQWIALLTGGVLLIPAVNMRAGPVVALMAATVAVVVTMTAVLSGHRSKKASAAVGSHSRLPVGCAGRCRRLPGMG